MVSTISSAGWPTLLIRRRTSATRLITPVDVSLCTIATALIARLRSLASFASTLAGSTPCRQSPVMKSTSRPICAAILRQSVAKWPVSHIRILSPGDSVFTSAASHAPVPDDGYTTTARLV